jgi:ribonuclease Z
VNTIPNHIRLFSKGLYSSWCYHQPHQTLFDCGEGCATALNNALPGLEHLFFTHDHGDHTLGLPSLIGCRNAAQGTSRNAETMDKHNKPLTIYVPADNKLFAGLFDFCEHRYADWLRYKISFVPITSGFELQVGLKTYIKAIEMRHQKNQSTLGYVIYENRTRLKKEFLGQDIKALVKQGMKREDLNEVYRANLFAYLLDAYEIVDAKEVTDCASVVIDCTFLKKEDRTDMTHFTLDEATTFCQSVGVKHMYSAHLSPRYDYADYVENDYMTVIKPDQVNSI